MIFKALANSNQAAIISKGWGQLGVIEARPASLPACMTSTLSPSATASAAAGMADPAQTLPACRGRSRRTGRCWWMRCHTTGSSRVCGLWCTMGGQAPLQPACWQPAPPPSCRSLATSPSGEPQNHRVTLLLPCAQA